MLIIQIDREFMKFNSKIIQDSKHFVLNSLCYQKFLVAIRFNSPYIFHPSTNWDKGSYSSNAIIIE